MVVRVMQYLRPYGDRRWEETDIGDEYQSAYAKMQTLGRRLSAEVLTTGHVSVAIEDDDQDWDMRIVSNGPNVQEAIEEMLTPYKDKEV